MVNMAVSKADKWSATFYPITLLNRIVTTAEKSIFLISRMTQVNKNNGTSYNRKVETSINWQHKLLKINFL